MITSMAWRLVAPLALLALLAGACGGGDDDDGSPVGGSTATPGAGDASPTAAPTPPHGLDLPPLLASLPLPDDSTQPGAPREVSGVDLLLEYSFVSKGETKDVSSSIDRKLAGAGYTVTSRDVGTTTALWFLERDGKVIRLSVEPNPGGGTLIKVLLRREQ